VFAAAWLPEHGDTRTALPVSYQPLQTFTVTTADDAGAGSLRQAILDANAAAGADTIAFSIGIGAASIQLSSELPDITGPVVIDGTTQPGFTGSPLIEVANFGLKITGGGSTLKSLIITGGPGVVLETGGGNTITGCRLSGLTDGVLINNSPDNQIGGTSASESNEIGGNGYGVRINGAASSGNIITGNYIGLFSDGSDGRNTLVGVAIEGASGNRIGGTTVGERNIISNNGGGSTSSFNHFRGNVLITGAGATGNVVEGNYIGTNIDGTADGAQSTSGNRHNGVRIEDGANNTVGGTVGTSPGGACTGACNVISGNRTNGGVFITGSSATGNNVVGNFTGTNAAGTAGVINQRGVTVTGGASNTTIGNGTAAGRNLISGTTGGLESTEGGIVLDGPNNTVHGNYIGSDTTGTHVLGNIPSGILVTGTDNTVGTPAGTTYGGACTGGCNLIVPSGGPGIRILGTTNPIGHNTVDYNYIGLNAAGDAALLGANFPGAIWIVDSGGNTIGHSSAEQASASVRTPDAQYCIQDPNTGDYLRFDDPAGSYEWKVCRTGESGTGNGIIFHRDEWVSIRGTRFLIGDVNTITETASAEFGRDSAVRDGQVNNSDCGCPEDGRQILVSGVYLRGANGSSDNAVVGNILNQTANDPNSNVTPGNSSSINLDRGSDNVFSNECSANIEPAAIISVGIRNEWHPTRYLSLFGETGVLLDLVGDANNGQEAPDVNSVLYKGSVDSEISGSISTDPDTTLEIDLFGEMAGHGSYYFRPNDRVGDPALLTRRRGSLLVSPIQVTTDSNGTATFSVESISGLRSFDHVRAVATVIAPMERAGNTSEMSAAVAVPRPQFDLDDDGKTDIAVFRPASGNTASYWYIRQSGNGSVRIQQFGIGDDNLVPGDYQGDGPADLAVRRSSNGTWYNARIVGDPATDFEAVPWGNSTDVPVIGDFLDLGANQQAVFRPSEGAWYIRNPLDENGVVLSFGLATDKLVPADYNGDGRTDPAIYRDGLWAINPCFGCDAVYFNFGTTNDVPVPGDFDGDGVADIAVWRPSTGVWYLNQSTDGFTAFQWGSNGDVPVNGDFDGDGKNDIAVWRPSSGIWYILRSTAGFYAIQWGQNGDIPVPKFQN